MAASPSHRSVRKSNPGEAGFRACRRSRTTDREFDLIMAGGGHSRRPDSESTASRGMEPSRVSTQTPSFCGSRRSTLAGRRRAGIGASPQPRCVPAPTEGSVRAPLRPCPRERRT